jgi:DNA-binding NarL/FixJ family response regulator
VKPCVHAALLKANPAIKIVAHSAHADKRCVLAMLNAGAVG